MYYNQSVEEILSSWRRTASHCTLLCGPP